MISFDPYNSPVRLRHPDSPFTDDRLKSGRVPRRAKCLTATPRLHLSFCDLSTETNFCDYFCCYLIEMQNTESARQCVIKQEESGFFEQSHLSRVDILAQHREWSPPYCNYSVWCRAGADFLGQHCVKYI